MKRIVIFTDGATLGIVRTMATHAEFPDHAYGRLPAGEARPLAGEGTGGRPRAAAEENAGEHLDFIALDTPARGAPVSAHELAGRISRIVRDERVDYWHLVAPPRVRKRMPDLLDDDVQRRLSRIGFGDLIAAAAECASIRPRSPVRPGAATASG